MKPASGTGAGTVPNAATSAVAPRSTVTIAPVGAKPTYALPSRTARPSGSSPAPGSKAATTYGSAGASPPVPPAPPEVPPDPPASEPPAAPLPPLPGPAVVAVVVDPDALSSSEHPPETRAASSIAPI